MTRRKTRHSEHMPPRASITVLSPCSEAETHRKNIPQDMMQNIDDGEEVQDFSADPQNIYSAQEDDARLKICSAKS